MAATQRGRVGAGHPRHRRSARWWVAQSAVTMLLLGALAALTLVSFVLAGLYLMTEDRSTPGAYQNHQPRVVWLGLAGLRALLGVDAFPRQADNPTHEALATAASLIGVVTPAIVIGIVIVRIFTVRVFEWRGRVNACLTAELDGDLLSEVADQRFAYLAVRWYKRLSNVSVTNLQAEAYVRCRTISRIDGSTMYRYQRLEVLRLDGTEALTCTWPETFSGMPFTLWIPLRAPLKAGKVGEIQGRDIADTDDRQLVVRLSGLMARPAGNLSEERTYDLVDDVQVGRFVPVEPNPSQPTRSWPGWRRFEESITHALFVYDELADPNELLSLLGRWPGDGDVARVRLSGFARSWRMIAVDGPAALLSLNLQTTPDGATDGLVVRVGAEQLTVLDARYPHYDRVRVTDQVDASSQRKGDMPDVIWAYVGRPEWVARADAAIAARVTWISPRYLKRLRHGFAAHGQLLDAFDDEPLPNGVTVGESDRRDSSVREADG